MATITKKLRDRSGRNIPNPDEQYGGFSPEEYQRQTGRASPESYEQMFGGIPNEPVQTPAPSKFNSSAFRKNLQGIGQSMEDANMKSTLNLAEVNNDLQRNRQREIWRKGQSKAPMTPAEQNEYNELLNSTTFGKQHLPYDQAIPNKVTMDRPQMQRNLKPKWGAVKKANNLP